jgi:protein-tyrosine-phosphatase/predicted ATP-grasp superfamily ATP-dependent carboligase
MAKDKVLVVGDDTRAFLAIVRSLGRQGVAVHAAPTNFCSPALHSRYLEKVHLLPPPTDDGAAWLSALESLIRAERFSLVIPCTDRSLLPLHAHRRRFAGLTRLAIPAPEHIDVLFDKMRTREVAASLGIGLARGFCPDRPPNAGDVFGQLGSPVVVKPRRSVDPDALHRQEQVQIVATPAELEAAVADRALGSYFLEAFFPGFGLGVSVLADRGAILQAFQHHRVHQAAGGGSSAYRISAALDPDLLAACQEMIRRLDYTGVAMFEFRRGAVAGSWVLLEVNARPWGSMPLPLALEVDFPFAWYRLLTTGERISRQSYRPGIYGRNLELDVGYAAKHVSELAGWRARIMFLGRWLWAFRRILIGRERIDTFAMDDPAPAVAECSPIASSLIRRCWERVPGHAGLRRMLARIRLRRALARALRAGKNPSIVFVCYGNICRSAFAERSLVKELQPLLSHVVVASAGTYPVGGRSSPSDAVEAALRYRIDLAPHRSQCITEQLLDAATVLVVFDRNNVETLKSQYPQLKCPIILLGSLMRTKERDGIIRDPYGGEPALFDRTFRLIEQGVATLYGHIFEVVPAKFSIW